MRSRLIIALFLLIGQILNFISDRTMLKAKKFMYRKEWIEYLQITLHTAMKIYRQIKSQLFSEPHTLIRIAT